jgi:hypothetical protein
MGELSLSLSLFVEGGGCGEGGIPRGKCGGSLRIWVDSGSGSGAVGGVSPLL